MLLIIFLVLILVLVQNMLPGMMLTRQVGAQAQMGSRDDLPEPTPELKRARKALTNLQESLPIFLTLAILSIVLGEEGWLSVLGATVFLLCRAIYPVFYLRAMSPWRSLAFLGGLLGMLIMAVPLLPHLWS